MLEGGFDRHDTFFYIPLGATAAHIEIWRRSVVALFLEKGLLNPDFARKILAWQHSGLSIESGTRILDQPTREALCQYLVRAPLSLRRIRWDEQQDTVTWSASPSGFFKGKVRRYSSRGRGTWKELPPCARARLPAGTAGRRLLSSGLSMPRRAGRSTRSAAVEPGPDLLAKVHELDVMACPRCGSRMSVIAVIIEPAQIRKATGAAPGIIDYLGRHGRGLPPLERGSTPPLGSAGIQPHVSPPRAR